MRIDEETGVSSGVPFYPSPHISARPDNGVVSLLVIHGICMPDGGCHVGEYCESFIHNLFTDQKEHPAVQAACAGGPVPEVSVHYVIYEGGELVQYAPTTMKAWHAGASSFQGQEGCNDFSIGIELEGNWQDNCVYTPAQYETLIEITRHIMAVYPEITSERIVGHSDIAPGRKADPGGGFDWAAYKVALEAGAGDDGVSS